MIEKQSDFLTLDYLLSLSRRDIRDQNHHFLVDGVRFVSAAAEISASIVGLVIAPDFLTHPYGQKVARELRRSGVPCLKVKPDAFRRLTRAQEPQGIAAVVRQRWDSLRRFPPGRNTCWICVEDVNSPGNLGTILRSCEATGATGAIFLGPRADPYDPTCIRASMSYLLTRSLVRTSYREFHTWKRRTDCVVVGTSPEARCDYRTFSYHRPTILMFGSERKGLSRRQKKLCDKLVRIPMVGSTDSLNLAVAASLMLYEVLNQRHPVKLKMV